MQDFRKQFPAAEKYTYLNTASCGLFSEALINWRRKHDQQLYEDGSEFRDLHKAHLREIRNGIADLFNTNWDSVALVPNFSYGMNSILDGLPQGQKILLLQGDYPSINWPVEHRGFDVCYAEIDEDMEHNIARAVSRHNPDVLALSQVQYISGIKIDFDFLRQLKADHPELMIIADGTQYLGTERFDFESSAFDVVGASTYKWLLAGYGNGFYLVKKEARVRISPKTIGYNSADNRKEDGSIPFIGYMEPGHQDSLNYGSLLRSIQLMHEIGIDRIGSYIKELSREAFNAFAELGLLDERVVKRDNPSTIFNLNIDQSAFKRLKSEGVIASWRGDGVRVSFHAYNNRQDLEKLLQIIKK